MATRVKVDSRYQIAVPAAIREKLHIKPGDHLLVEVRDGHVVLTPEPRDYAEYMRGLHREVWEGVDPIEYSCQERGEWPE